jgi:hypothetical protein
MSSETFAQPENADAEFKMRRSLGLSAASNPGAVSSPAPVDPNRIARQAIRSQATAREYAERQLAHAETTINDLRARLQHTRREKDAAVDAARVVTGAKIIAERSLMASEASLSAEKTARDRTERALRESQAMLKELEGRLDAARQSLQMTQTELAAERQSRLKPKETPRVVTAQPEFAAPTDPNDAGFRPVARGRGRPRKINVIQPVAVQTRASTSVIATTATVKQTKRKPVKSSRSPAPKPIKWWIKG